MISITEEYPSKRGRIETNYKIPPWVSVPAAAGAAGLGTYGLAKAAGRKSLDAAGDAGGAVGDWASGKAKAFGKWARETASETGRRMKQAAKDAHEKLQIKGQETRWPFDESLETIISIGLLNEIKKINAAHLKKRAGMRALSKGQPRLMRDPADKIARAQIDGGNRLVFGAVGKKPYMRTVS